MTGQLPPQLVDSMRQRGYHPDKLKPSGAGFLRFRLEDEATGKTSGFIKLFPDGEGAIFGDFKSDTQFNWHAQNVKTFSPEQREAHQRKVEQARNEAAAEQARMREAAAKKAIKLWGGAGLIHGEQPYVLKKGIKPSGAKQLKNHIVVPVRRIDGELINLQFIGEDGTKRFLTGGEVKGGFCFIGEPTKTMCIAEGWATACSIREATGHAVVVAFNAGNLEPVARAIREKYPDARLILAADNDQFTDGNPGITKATAAARAVGALLAVPDFTGCDLSSKPTDLNDMHLLKDVEAVKQAIDAAGTVDTPKPQSQRKAAPASDTASRERDAEQEQGEQPILFGKIDTPEILPDRLPGVFGKFAAALAETLQVSVTMPVLLILSVLSLALQRKFVVSPFGDGYTEQVCIWVNLLADTGERKSAVLKPILAPVILWETKHNLARESEIIEVDTLRAINQKRIEKLHADAAKEDSAVRRGELVREISELREQTPEPKVPIQLFTGDTTIEEMQNLFVKHKGKLSVMATEGGIFAVLAGLYSGGESYTDAALQAYSGDPVRVNRGSRVAIIERPTLTFGICMQPDLIKDMKPEAKRKFRSSGLFARFFWGLPASSIGKRDMGRRGAISAEITAQYRAAVLGLLDIEPITNDLGEESEHVLTLSEQARAGWISFAQNIEDGQSEGGKLETLRDWCSKLPGGALRLAGLLHVAEHGYRNGTEINADTMRRAVSICAVLIPHTAAVFDMIGADPSIEDAKVLWRWIERTCKRDSKREVLRSECHKALHGRFAKVDRLIAAFEVLKGRNLVTGPHKAAGTTNKPTIFYLVNPLALDGVKP